MKRTILVTGANRGIGLAIVQGLAKNQDDLILLGSRVLENGEAEAKKIGNNVKAVELDLGDKDKLQRNIDLIKKTYGQIDVLINNAAVLREGRLLDISEDQFQESLQVNVLAPHTLICAFVPKMIERGYGRVVNTSSAWGSVSDGLNGPFAYSFTKAALNALTITLFNDLPSNVKVNSMCPGWVKTRMGGEDAPRTPEQGAETAIWLANLPADGPSGSFFRDKKKIEW